jgi:hypothetical protein
VGTGQHGGRRPGAGRPPGAATKKTRAVADRAALGDVTPLDVMLDMLTGAREFDQSLLEVAKAAAPYVHPRLSAVEAKHTGEMTLHGGVDLPKRAETQEEWIARRHRELQAVGAAAGSTVGRH